MSDDYAGGHHFQLESAVTDIQEQMARFQKATAASTVTIPGQPAVVLPAEAEEKPRIVHP